MSRLRRWRRHWRLYPLNFVVVTGLIIARWDFWAGLYTALIAQLAWAGGVLHERYCSNPLTIRLDEGVGGVAPWCEVHLTVLDLRRLVSLDVYDCPHCGTPLKRPTESDIVEATERWSNSGGRDWLRSIGYI